MSDNWKIQISPKLPDGTLINLRAETPEEFATVIGWATAHASEFVDVIAALNGVPPALAGNVVPGSVQVQQEPPQQQNNGGWGAPQQQQQAPQYSQPAQAAPACRHGQREWREGTSKAGKPYKMWACPSGNRQDQCEPQWVR